MREMRVSNSVSIYRSSAFSRSRISSPIGFMAFKKPPYRPYKRPIYNRQSVELNTHTAV